MHSNPTPSTAQREVPADHDAIDAPRRDYRDLAIESLAEENLHLERQRDQACAERERARAEAQTYRRLALAALDYARACAITEDDGRDRHIIARLTTARDRYIEQRLRRIA
jgi:hypothetical protein